MSGGTLPPYMTDVPPIEAYEPLSSGLNGHALDLRHIELIRGGKNGDGQIKPLMANVVSVLRAAPKFFNLRYDTFAGRPYRGYQKLTDQDFLDVTNWVQRIGIHADVRTVTNAVMYVAGECVFHPVREYLDGLKWDKTDRLDHIFIENGGAPDTPAIRAVSRKWHIQAVARVMHPGAKADSMLILEGKQGLYKSSYFDHIARPWFSDHISNIGNKDARQELRGVWIMEMAELDSMHRSETSTLKGFLTTRSDHYRDPYGRLTDDWPRQCVFAGTINPGGLGFLKDATGARRFWFVPISEKIDVKLLDRDQIWAEAVHRYSAKEPWHITDEAVASEIAQMQSDRYEGDVWEEKVAEYVIGRNRVTTANVLVECIGKKIGDCTKYDSSRIGTILHRLGWSDGRETTGDRDRYFERPATKVMDGEK